MTKEKKRIGKFYLPFEMINKNIIVVRLIMQRMIFIPHAKVIEDIKMVEYICQSEIFNEIAFGDDPPEYIVSIKGNGEITAQLGESVKKPIVDK